MPTDDKDQRTHAAWDDQPDFQGIGRAQQGMALAAVRDPADTDRSDLWSLALLLGPFGPNFHCPPSASIQCFGPIGFRGNVCSVAVRWDL